LYRTVHDREKDSYQALTPKEIRVFLLTFDEAEVQQAFKLALKITLHTLTRKSELRLAEWKDVNFETGVWTTAAQNNKTNAEHVVSMSA
jgi:integrase